MRHFLREGPLHDGGSHLVGRDYITLPTDKSGLGVDKVKTSNDTLLSKWIWRYLTESDSLQRRLINTKYKISYTSCFTSPTVPWFHIMKFDAFMKNNIQRKIRDAILLYLVSAPQKSQHFAFKPETGAYYAKVMLKLKNHLFVTCSYSSWIWKKLNITSQPFALEDILSILIHLKPSSKRTGLCGAISLGQTYGTYGWTETTEPSRMLGS